MAKMCVMEDRECIECGQCNMCDLDQTKVCDNCCKCLGDADYRAIEIDDILLHVERAGDKKREDT